MKLSDHTDHIRKLIDTAFRNRLDRMGISKNALTPIVDKPAEYRAERKRMETIREVFIAETGTVTDAWEKLVEELTFTLFNRLAALKVMEAHTLHPEIVTRRETHGGRSFAHLAWLEQNPQARSQEAEGLESFLENQFTKLSVDIPLFSLDYPYHLLPTALELMGIINSFNQVETDDQVDADIWKSDDVLGWLYESYNIYKKKAHDASGQKTEYNKVSIQSQYYTPRWVVQFLVDNSLGKMYLEMYPDSGIRHKYKIANVPQSQCRDRKFLHEIKLIDPANGSGNYLLYGFDLFYDLYIDQIENYGADYDENEIPKLIIENNLHGIDLDDRAVQLTQLGLFIKAKRKKRTTKIEHFNIVSSDFFLPAYEKVSHIFENENVDGRERAIIMDLWDDLQNAHKFGSLVRLEEKLNLKWFGTKEKADTKQLTFFGKQELEGFEAFRGGFFTNLQKAVSLNTEKQGKTFLNTKTQDAITFLQLLTQSYDVAVANPPYTPSAEFGDELKEFIEKNYKDPINNYENLYGCFIQRCLEITRENGFIAMITPQTFMFISSFKSLRKMLLESFAIQIFVQFGFGGIFKVSIDPCFYIIKKSKQINPTVFFKLDHLFNDAKVALFESLYVNYLIHKKDNPLVFITDQEALLSIPDQPFIYWISSEFREKFKVNIADKFFDIRQGIATGNNFKFCRYWWEVYPIINVDSDLSPYHFYAKGGTFNRWHGNLWLIIKFDNEAKNLLANSGNHLPSRTFYFREGITYSASGRGGYAFRYLPPNCLFDVGGSSIFLNDNYPNLFYALGFLNSKLSFYIADCLNPTANIQVGDIKRIPFVIPDKESEFDVAFLAKENVNLIKKFNRFKIFEPNFEITALEHFVDKNLTDRVINYNISSIEKDVLVLINEAVINEIIFNVYSLSKDDKTLVDEKMGLTVGSYPLFFDCKHQFLGSIENFNLSRSQFVEAIDVVPIDPKEISQLKNYFMKSLGGDFNTEEFCRKHSINPLIIWIWLKELRVYSSELGQELILEFLIFSFTKLLIQDQDGIIPLFSIKEELSLIDRLEEFAVNNALTSAQFDQIQNLLSNSLEAFLIDHFFVRFSDHLNMFNNMPKTPFIWHLSSGDHHGFDVYTIIYKWNRDSLFKLKSQYISNRVQNLEYRQIQLQGVSTAQAQNEKEHIRLQLKEIDVFTKKIDELIAEGYDPKLDDGVGKNIAPLQKKGMLRAEVLKENQLTKYLKADW